MCCLQYENDYYSEVYKLMQRVHSEVSTPDGKGIVQSNDMLKKLVVVKITDKDGNEEIRPYPLAQIKAKHTLTDADLPDAEEDIGEILD